MQMSRSLSRKPKPFLEEPNKHSWALSVDSHTHTKEGILIINYSNGCLTVNDFQFPVNCGKVFNFKYKEEASNLYEQKTATTVNLHSKEENFLKLFIYK